MVDTNEIPTTIQQREIQETPIKGLVVITVKQISEGRGTIREYFRKSTSEDLHGGDLGNWAQINVTETQKGAIRGIHAEEMNKLVGIIAGEAFGVYVDLRNDSPTKGTVFSINLKKGIQVFVPKGVGNGLQSISEEPSQYLYCFDEEWTPEMPGTSVNPFDPTLNIQWPIEVDRSNTNLVSKKDNSAPFYLE